MRLTILSRASDLARIQSGLVARTLSTAWPDAEITQVVRAAAGDRDQTTPLMSLPDKGAFTADLSDELSAGRADAVVHSWKDLPLESRPDTVIAATLERADPRDVLLVRRDAVSEHPRELDVLTSSPRRTWLIEHSIPSLLPWPVTTLRAQPVRGNVPTRLHKLLEGPVPALIVAKAAIDRLLDDAHPFDDARRAVRTALDRCHWMVLPISRCPTAPAQGALAVEVAAHRRDLIDRFAAVSDQATWRAVTVERAVLARYGGGCHQALGTTCLTREFGDVLSIRGRRPDGGEDVAWTLTNGRVPPPRASGGKIWPRPDERHRATRRDIAVTPPANGAGFWVTRADALPETWVVPPDRLVWTAGARTWEKLAARGVWVHGSADNLGDVEPAAVERLAGRDPDWCRLTHADAQVPGALATYAVEEPLPDDLAERSHFFWTSGATFRRALERWPSIQTGWHATGPGHTRRVVEAALGQASRVGVWLDYDTWYREVLE